MRSAAADGVVVLADMDEAVMTVGVVLIFFGVLTLLAAGACELWDIAVERCRAGRPDRDAVRRAGGQGDAIRPARPRNYEQRERIRQAHRDWTH